MRPDSLIRGLHRAARGNGRVGETLREAAAHYSNARDDRAHPLSPPTSGRRRPRPAAGAVRARARRAARAHRLRAHARLDRRVGGAPRQRGYICVAAVHTVMAGQEDPELREAVLASDLTVPDGQPLVWAMNLLGHSLPSRVYGPDLFKHACERPPATGARFYLYGGRAESLAHAARRAAAPLPRPADRRRPARAVPRARRRGGGRDRRRHQRRRRRRRLGRPRRPAAGEVDGRDARAARRAGAGRRRRGVRLPRRPQAARRPTASSGSGSSGRSASRRSRGGCGGATCTTTRASSIGFARQYARASARPALAFPEMTVRRLLGVLACCARAARAAAPAQAARRRRRPRDRRPGRRRHAPLHPRHRRRAVDPLAGTARAGRAGARSAAS